MKKYLGIIYFLTAGISLSQSREDKIFESLVENSFQEIWSNLNTGKIATYYTDDFVLFEDGEIQNIDSVYAIINNLSEQFNSEENKNHKFERTNQFKFIKSHVEEDSGWIYYENFADFTMDGTSISKMHWLESAICIKTADGWKIRFLHSSPVKEKSENESN